MVESLLTICFAWRWRNVCRVDGIEALFEILTYFSTILYTHEPAIKPRPNLRLSL